MCFPFMGVRRGWPSSRPLPLSSCPEYTRPCSSYLQPVRNKQGVVGRWGTPEGAPVWGGVTRQPTLPFEFFSWEKSRFLQSRWRLVHQNLPLSLWVPSWTTVPICPCSWVWPRDGYHFPAGPWTCGAFPASVFFACWVCTLPWGGGGGGGSRQGGGCWLQNDWGEQCAICPGAPALTSCKDEDPASGTPEPLVR